MWIERIERGGKLLDLKCGLEPVVEDSSCTRAGLPAFIGDLASFDILALLSMGLGNCGNCPIPKIVAGQEISPLKRDTRLCSIMVNDHTAQVYLANKEGATKLLEISWGRVIYFNAALLPNFRPQAPHP